MVSRNEREEGAIADAESEDDNHSEISGPTTSEPNRELSETKITDEKEKTIDPKEEKDVKLSKSPRFTGYLTMFLSSIINYHGVIVSQNTTDVHVIASTGVQRQYGYIVALISCLASGFCVVCHLDRISCFASTWKNKLFAPKSKFETILDFSLLLWWCMAVVIQTRADGIAGDGKGQYNIYFSSWFCLLCAISAVESKMMEYDWPSIKRFIKSWPHRSPGWIAILASDFFTLWWYVDIYITYVTSSMREERLNPMLVSYYGSISSTQYEILILVAAATLLPATGFVFIEIFRDSSEDKRGSLETYIEAFCLFSLACAWIPGVCVATTPGGFATQIGNSWFFTWSTCYFVMETLLWFVSDSRGGIRQTLIEKEQEYQQYQLNVLEAAHDIADASVSKQGDDDIEEESAENSIEKPKPSPDYAAAFEMQDLSENEDSLDDSIKQEIRMKEANQNEYFDNLEDILE
mmetsp:Transcript_22196/g.52763  ORF Transcript_22196/g.52763 Transcript_22196/m.52763 type:complete len:464 (+) Transcript_22196:104-1495(+)|eukprot:CAMPEP_0197198448 /NCGR_PEP_ID=MMETSP1423-20130617/33369_1 /TAXON_ID=476441 /ORGANISM="Pseudo-nitzschia heimii, Strain UNC1101" /LENGTH=463 /DNA_ID=CAMNT_0042652281 /DNA_START=66 /DNA_END=1457 /DNA_ORIENTATION=+